MPKEEKRQRPDSIQRFVWDQANYELRSHLQFDLVRLVESVQWLNMFLEGGLVILGSTLADAF